MKRELIEEIQGADKLNQVVKTINKLQSEWDAVKKQMMGARDKCLMACGLKNTGAGSGTIALGLAVAMVEMGMSLDDMTENLSYLKETPWVTFKPIE